MRRLSHHSARRWDPYQHAPVGR